MDPYACQLTDGYEESRPMNMLIQRSRYRISRLKVCKSLGFKLN